MTDYAPEFLLGAFAGESNIETFQLASGYTVNPGDFVKLTSSAASIPSTVQPIAAIGDPVIGVVQRVSTAMGLTWVSCVVHGKVKVTAGAAISVGAKLKAKPLTVPSTPSYAVPAVIGTDALTAIYGTALQAATASGDTILVAIAAAAP